MSARAAELEAILIARDEMLAVLERNTVAAAELKVALEEIDHTSMATADDQLIAQRDEMRASVEAAGQLKLALEDVDHTSMGSVDEQLATQQTEMRDGAASAAELKVALEDVDHTSMAASGEQLAAQGEALRADTVAAEEFTVAIKESGIAAVKASEEGLASQVQLRDELGRFAKARESVNQTSLAPGLQEETKSTKEWTNAVGETRAQLAIQKAEIKTWNKEAKEATGAVSMGFLGVGAALVIGAGASIAMAANFEAGTARLITSAGESRQNIEGVRTGMLKMAGDVGFSADELAKGMYTVESAGFHAADGLTVERAAAEGAKTENAELKVVADATTTALRDYHLSASDAAMVTSKMITAVSDGKTTFAEFTGSLHSVLPVASAAHISLSDVLAAVSAMTLHGMSADQATQNLAHTIQHLQTVTAPQAKELAALGLSARTVSDDLGKKGLTGTVQEISDAIQKHMGKDGHVVLELTDALKKLPPEVQKVGMEAAAGTITQGEFMKATKGMSVEAAGQAAQFATLLKASHGVGQDQKTGAEIMQSYAQALKLATGDSTTLNTALMLTGENADITNKAVRDVSGAAVEAGNHVKGWGEIQSTFNNHLDRLKDGAGAAAIQLGERMLPAASKLLGQIADGLPGAIAFANKLVDIGQAISPLLPWVATAVGLFIAWKIAMTVGTAVMAIQTFAMAAYESYLVATTATTGGMTAAQWLLNVAMDANPVGLVVLGLAALIGITILVITHWKEVTAALASAWNWIHKAADAISHFAETHRALVVVLAILLGPIVLVIAGIALLITHWNQVVAVAQKVWGWLVQVGAAIFNFAKAHPALLLLLAPLLAILAPVILLGAGIYLLATHFKQVLDAGGRFFSWLSNALSDKSIGAFFSNLGAMAHHAVEAVGNAFSSLGTLVHNALVGVVVWFIWLQGETQTQLAKLWADAQALFQAGIDLVTGIVKGFVEGVVRFFSWLYDHNYYFKNLVDNIRAAFQAIHDDAVRIWNAVTGFISATWKTIHDDAVAAWTVITGWLRLFWEAEVRAWTFIWNKVSDLIRAVWKTVHDDVVAAWNAIVGWLRPYWEAEIRGWQIIWNRVSSFLSALWNGVRDAAVGAWNSITGAISSKVHEVWNSITGALGGLEGWFGDISDKAWNWGANLISSIGSGIAAKAGVIATAVRAIGGVIADWLGFHSPTRLGPGADADKWMPNMVRMMATGITDGAPQIHQAMQGLSGALASGLTSPRASSSALGALSAGGALGGGAGAAGGYRTANITLAIDGRQLVRIIGQPLVDEIRLKTGTRALSV